MKRTFGIFSATAMAVALAGCSFSIGGPSQEDIEESIVENYENEGFENISVQLEPSDDGTYTGEVEFTIPDTGVVRNLACTAEPGEGTEVSWECMPRIEDLEQVIVTAYSERGAEQVSAELAEDGEQSYAGHVDYTDPNTGQAFRHNCTFNLAGANSDWQCAP
jgi:hypothetical protein